MTTETNRMSFTIIDTRPGQPRCIEFWHQDKRYSVTLGETSEVISQAVLVKGAWVWRRFSEKRMRSGLALNLVLRAEDLIRAHDEEETQA